jgi:hypothetical protein
MEMPKLRARMELRTSQVLDMDVVILIEEPLSHDCPAAAQAETPAGDVP